MDQFKEIKNTLTWHNEGKFEVELVNGIIRKLNFSEPGKGPGDLGKSLTSTSYKYLQSVYYCLGELFAFIQEEEKRMGYSYARSTPMDQYQPEDAVAEFPGQPEPKLWPLINYDDQPAPEDDANAEKIPMRDIG
jgi:hypothetical protein